MIRYWLFILCGVLQALALAAPWSGEANASLQVAALALFIALQQEDDGFQKSFWPAWLFATSWLLASVWWLFVSIHDFGGMPISLTIAAMLLLCGALAVYYALMLSVYLKIKKGYGPWLGAGLLASCWTLGELARAEFFTGFPWGAIGYAHIDSALVMLAPWVGVYGIGWVAAFLASLLAEHLKQIKAKQTNFFAFLWPVLGLIALALPWETHTKKSEETFSVSLLQGNIPQDLKFTQAREESLRWYTEQALLAESDLVVMPETALPYLKQDLPVGVWDKLQGHFASGEKALVMGIPTFEPSKGFGNSAIAIQANNEEYIYNKQHLVPFGEFVPRYFKWFNQAVNFGITDFVRGPVKPQPLLWKHYNLAVQICYEDLFGEELAQRFIDSDNTPTVLVNLSNIAWFGNTVVIPQHLHIARMRSIELNRPTVRATNSGGTAIIDAGGKVLAKAQAYTKTVLVGEVPISDGRMTGYAQWAGRWGLWPLWILCIAVVLVLSSGRIRQRSIAPSH